MKKMIKDLVKRRFTRLVKVEFDLIQAFKKACISRPAPAFRKAISGVSVCYLSNIFPRRPPNRNGFASGGNVKLLYLAEVFPHSYPSANILYSVSSVGHMQTPEIVSQAKDKKLKVVVNQNGVAYPAWHGPGWEASNKWHNAHLEQADYIVYQSKFCQIGAEHFLTPPDVPHDVIYNPVDTSLFRPVQLLRKPKNLTLLLGGNQNERYRLELALLTFQVVLRENPNARLMVTGHLWKPEADAHIWTQRFLKENDLLDKVILTGAYSQKQAPDLFNQAHILLHTQYNDASPTLVLEAMASGLPVVYLDCGGVPELVAQAGLGVPVAHSWDNINLPDPEAIGTAVLEIMPRYAEFAKIARERTNELFSLKIFIEKHRQIFENVLGR